MSLNANALRSLVSISQFSKGQAAKVFDRLNEEDQLIVLKNNVPTAVLLSPQEYIRLSEIEEDYRLLTEAQARLNASGLEASLPEKAVMDALGVTEDDILSAEDVELE